MQPMGNKEMDARIGVARHLLDDIYGLIASGDAKAQLLLSADAIIAGLLTLSFSAFGATRIEPIGPLMIAAATLGIVVLAVSAGLALWVMRPRISRGMPRSMFYFRDIKQMSLQEFVTGFNSMSAEQTIEDILSQIHAISPIADEKFRWAFWSGVALGIAILIWTIVLAVLFVL